MSFELPIHLLTPQACRMARAGLGLIQAELASASGVHKRTIKMLEGGKRIPLRQTSCGIMQALINRGVVFGFDGSLRIDGNRPLASTATKRPRQHYHGAGAEARAV